MSSRSKMLATGLLVAAFITGGVVGGAVSSAWGEGWAQGDNAAQERLAQCVEPRSNILPETPNLRPAPFEYCTDRIPLRCRKL